MNKMSLEAFLKLNELELSSIELSNEDKIFIVLDSGEIIEIVKEVTE